MAVTRKNVTVDEKLLEEFYYYADKRGITISPFLSAKMREFIAEEKEFEKFKEMKTQENI